ncbi:MAG: PH domain-containing protein [Anaerolineales bacterium]
MRFAPQRTAPLALLGAGSFFSACVAALCVWRLVRPPLDWSAALALLGLCATAILLPLLVARIRLLLGATYEIEPRAISIRWGRRLEIVPLSSVEVIHSGRGIPAAVRLAAGGWTRFTYRQKEFEGLGRVECFVSQTGANLILVSTPISNFLLSPADPLGFAEAFRQGTEHGTAERVSPQSIRPVTLADRLLQDRLAMPLIALGLVALLGLAMFLIWIQPALAGAVPFAFDPSGRPASPGSPARLLLLPGAGALTWILDVLLGLLAFDRSDRAAALTLWLVGIFLVLGLWVGVLSLIAAR